MSRRSVESVVTELAESIAPAFQLEIVDVTYKKEGGQWYLRVFIDKPGGISLEDCSLFNQTLSAKLDEEDPTPGSYLLEVSSPGAERPLKKEADFQRFTGEMVEIKTFAPIQGQKKWRGRLVTYQEGILIIDSGGKQITIPLDKVAKASLAVEF